MLQAGHISIRNSRYVVRWFDRQSCSETPLRFQHFPLICSSWSVLVHLYCFALINARPELSFPPAPPALAHGHTIEKPSLEEPPELTWKNAIEEEQLRASVGSRPEPRTVVQDLHPHAGLIPTLMIFVPTVLKKRHFQLRLSQVILASLKQYDPAGPTHYSKFNEVRRLSKKTAPESGLEGDVNLDAPFSRGTPKSL
jgi:hypothetical protein